MQSKNIQNMKGSRPNMCGYVSVSGLFLGANKQIYQAIR